MATGKRRSRKRGESGSRSTRGSSGRPLVIYVHGIGRHRGEEELKREWDLALFGREMRELTRMAYWSNILHPGLAPKRVRSAAGTKDVDVDALLRQAGLDADDPEARAVTAALLRAMGMDVAGARKKVLPLPAFLRKPIARRFLEALVKDTAAYFFRTGVRKRVQERFLSRLRSVDRPITVVAHSQGTVVALEVLAKLPRRTKISVDQLITIGSPLGIREVQDFLECPLEVPSCVTRWHNFADPLDPVALDKGIGNDFGDDRAITDELVVTTRSRALEGFNPHSAAGYLATPKVREVVHASARLDTHARFVVARDVAETLAVDERHPVLIEILEPGYPALDEKPAEMIALEKAESRRHGGADLATRIERAAAGIEKIVGDGAGANALGAARVERLRRFVAARLTPVELSLAAHRHADLRIYAMWKSSTKRKLLERSLRVVQADAARASYGATGNGITWAVLDTGIRHDHPHFQTHATISAIWDCTKYGPPAPIPEDKDRDGHGTHVGGIIAGSSADGSIQGIAPMAKLIVYKVLDDAGTGEDAWIIKALDHIAEQNESHSSVLIHGVNLSLGGSYDSTVYGCGFTPICVELRRLWRAGVIVCVASGNEGQVEVTTPDGAVELNSTMSIGDPANLEDAIAVGSVNADRPHLYGVSSFSSRGPTSDGRVKPDVVAPGERIESCDSRFRSRTKHDDLYRQDSGTSMAAPHVSGLLAAFLSVRREFRGRPDEVKVLLMRTSTDIGRDRYHQGHGVPNLMRMLLEA